MVRISDIKKNLSALIDRNIVIFYILLFLIIQLPNFNYTLFHEEFRDYNAYVSTLNGKLPYFDYRWLYGPLVPFVYAFIFKAFGANIITLRITEILFACAGIALSYRICKFILPGKIAALAGFVSIASLFGFPTYTYNHFFGTLANLGVTIMIFRFINYSKTYYLFLAGLILNISFLINPMTFGVQMLFSILAWLAVSLIIRKLNPARFFRLAAILTFAASIFTIPVYSFILSKTSFFRAFDLIWCHTKWAVKMPAFEIDFSNVISALGLIYKLRSIRYTLLKCFVNPFFFYLLLFIVPLTALALAVYWLKHRNDYKSFLEISFLSIVTFSGIGYSVYSGGRLSQYYLQYPLILFVFICYKIFRYLRLNNLRALNALARSLCLLLVMVFLFFYHGYRVANFFIRKWSTVNMQSVKGMRLSEEDINKYILPSEYMKENSDKGDKLFVAFYDSAYYVLTGLQPIFPEDMYTAITAPHKVMDSSFLPHYRGKPMPMEDVIIERMKEEKPKFIVKSVKHIVIPNIYISDIGPKAEKYIDDNYSISKIFPNEEGEIRVYEKKGHKRLND